MVPKRNVVFYSSNVTPKELSLPFVGKIRAGFASPAADYLNESIDLNQLIIKNKDYTFIGRVEGNSMTDASLNDGDLVLIDRSLEPRDNDAVLVFIDGEFTMKFVSVDKETQTVWLVPANAGFPRMQVTPESDFRIWGVVTYSITKHRK